MATMAVAAVLAVACSREPAPPTADEAWEAARAGLEATEDREEAIRILRDYLGKHPVTRRTAGLLGYLAEMEGLKAGRPAEVEALVLEIRPRVEDEDQRFELDKLLVQLAALRGDAATLEARLAELTAQRELTFTDRLELMEGLAAGEAWQTVAELADAALGQATAEAYRADYPDTELSPEELEERAAQRRVLALSYRGRAAAKAGRVEEALADFRAAEPMASFNYAGVPESPLLRWWGAAALEAGDAERALELLAPDAVMGGNEEAMADLRRAYAARFGSEEGIGEYLWSTRDRLARPIDGFTLTDYEGNEVSLDDFNGEVRLLAFWFPT